MTENRPDPFNLTVRPGRGSSGTLFLFIEYDGRTLSISGVEGPKQDGASGSCGQVIDTLREIGADPERIAAGWSREKIARLAEIWDRWHLNDLRAGCEHQRAEGWDRRPIDPAKPLNTYGLHFQGQRHASWNMLTWLRPDEHPEGLMTKPCPVCGYRYGTRWLFEEIPPDVLNWLAQLPEDGAELCPPVWKKARQ